MFSIEQHGRLILNIENQPSRHCLLNMPIYRRQWSKLIQAERMSLA